MKLPRKTLEKRLLADGYRHVIGVDEVGMGCLAGPVVVCAVLLTKEFFLSQRLTRFGREKIQRHPKLRWLRDSKLLLPHQREKFVSELLKERGLKFQTAHCLPKTIDKINIYQAARLAMKRAVGKLVNSLQFTAYRKKLISLKTDNCKLKTIVLVDGKSKIDGLKIPQIAIVKGDRKVFSIACASIIAKVTRDKMMKKYAKKFPNYGFERHKGYATKLHKAMLAQHGICKIHRKSFNPIAKLL